MISSSPSTREKLSLVVLSVSRFAHPASVHLLCPFSTSVRLPSPSPPLYPPSSAITICHGISLSTSISCIQQNLLWLSPTDLSNLCSSEHAWFPLPASLARPAYPDFLYNNIRKAAPSLHLQPHPSLLLPHHPIAASSTNNGHAALPLLCSR